jgi:hypothetical protein
MLESTKQLIKDIEAMPKTWGTSVIPKEKWIDPAKTYKTRDGKRVIDIHIVMKNSCGDEVTYPVKGSIVIREKPWKTEWAIWSLDGRADVVWGNHSERDLVEA